MNVVNVKSWGIDENCKAYSASALIQKIYAFGQPMTSATVKCIGVCFAPKQSKTKAVVVPAVEHA